MMRRYALTLFVISVLLASLLITAQLTSAPRAQSLRFLQAQALQGILPAHSYNNDLIADSISVYNKPYLQLPQPRPLYIAKLDGLITGFIIPVHTPQAYSGSIDSLIGVDNTGRITGIKILQHKETPGLGDSINSDWLNAFNGLSQATLAQEQWAVKKDGGVFDQFTGATITPRAFVQSVHQALLFFSEQQSALSQHGNHQ